MRPLQHNEQLYFETIYFKDEVKLLLESYFKKTQGSIGKGVAFSGLFISEQEFEIRSRWEINFYSKPYQRVPYILGVILSDSDGKTKIQLTRRKGYILKWQLLILLILPTGFLIISNVMLLTSQSLR